MITKAGILGYCSNIHPGEEWEEHFSEIQKRYRRNNGYIFEKHGARCSCQQILKT